MREQSSKLLVYDLCQVVYDETIEDGFHGFVTKHNHLLQLSPRLASRFGATELRYFSQSNRRENFQNRTKSKTKHGKSLKKFVGQVQRQKLQLKNAASCRLSSEFEGDKNGFHQFNKNPKYQSAKKLI